MESRKSINEPICRAAMETQTQRTDLWTWGSVEEGEGGMYGESKMETYTLPYVKQPMGICCVTQGIQTSAL